MKKATIATKAVAWNAGQPTKYQSAAEVQVSDDRIIRISGYPKKSEKEAREALNEEYTLWLEALKSFGEIINLK